jgi:hypothetical protein
MAKNPQQPQKDITDWLPRWMHNEKKRKTVGFAAVGFAAVEAAAWAAFIHFSAAEVPKQVAQAPVTVSPTISPQMNQTVIVNPSTPSTETGGSISFQFCVGDDNWGGGCPSGAKRLPCEVNPYQYWASECDKFSAGAITNRGGGKCGFTLYTATCTAKKTN